MTESSNPHREQGTHDGIPIVDAAIVSAFFAEPHDFEILFKHLRSENPALANFIVGRSAQLAPDDLKSKENIVRLALEMYDLLGKPHEIAELESQLQQILPEHFQND